jgi:hypothetical protein
MRLALALSALLAWSGVVQAQTAAEPTAPPKSAAEAVLQAYMLYCLPQVIGGVEGMTSADHARSMGYTAPADWPFGSPFTNRSAPFWSAPTPEGQLLVAAGAGDPAAAASCDIALYGVDPAAANKELVSWLVCDECPFKETGLPDAGPAPSGVTFGKYDWLLPGGTAMISVVPIALAQDRGPGMARLRISVFRVDQASVRKGRRR